MTHSVEIGQKYECDPWIRTVLAIGPEYVTFRSEDKNRTTILPFSTMEIPIFLKYSKLIKPKIKRWINIYPDKYANMTVGAFDSQQLADLASLPNRIACIWIEFEEGEGL